MARQSGMPPCMWTSTASNTGNYSCSLTATIQLPFLMSHVPSILCLGIMKKALPQKVFCIARFAAYQYNLQATAHVTKIQCGLRFCPSKSKTGLQGCLPRISLTPPTIAHTEVKKWRKEDLQTKHANRESNLGRCPSLYIQANIQSRSHRNTPPP